MTLSPDIAVLRWGLVAQTLIRHRDELMWLASHSDNNGRMDTPEQKDCFRRAARSLDPSIAEAVKSRKEVDERINAGHRDKPTAELISDDEFLRIGKAAQSKSITEMTNVEASACMAYDSAQKRAAIDRDGCCGGTPTEDGICFGVGQCPRSVEAARSEAFAAEYRTWLEQINDDSGYIPMGMEKRLRFLLNESGGVE